jgi:hypothetical protein
VNDFLVAEVEHQHTTVQGRAAADLLDGRIGVLAVERDALRDVRGGKDLLDRQLQTAIDELQHELVVRDAELAEPAETGARIHQEAQENPAPRVEDVLHG